MTTSVLEGLADRLERKLTQSKDAGGPPSTREGRDAWRKYGALAVRSLEKRGLFEALDSKGQPLGASLLAVAEGAIWHPFVSDQALLLAELARNIDQPGRINQGWKGTCAATCVECYLAERDPAEYARIVAGLVSMEGRAVLRSGEELVCDEDTMPPSVAEHGRTLVSRVFQVACMEFADLEHDYDNQTDAQLEGDTPVGSGLEMGPFERLLRAVTGREWKTTSKRHAEMAKLFAKLGLPTDNLVDIERDALSILAETMQKGEQLFATLDLPSAENPLPGATQPVVHASHKVRVLDINWTDGTVLYDDPMDPHHPWFEGATVKIRDEQGHCSMPIEDFQRLLSELHYLPELWERSRAAPA